MMQQNPSRSMMVMGTAPDAARYSIARFRSGVRASIADSDVKIGDEWLRKKALCLAEI